MSTIEVDDFMDNVYYDFNSIYFDSSFIDALPATDLNIVLYHFDIEEGGFAGGGAFNNLFVINQDIN